MEKAPVTRIELHTRVWQTPLSRLAPELGLSDYALRKLCQRHDIPVPARGYWARLAAGQRVKPSKLPRPDDDSPLALPSPREARRRVEGLRKAAITKVAVREAKADAEVPSVEIRPTLGGSHQLVRNTERFFTEAAAKIERRKKEAAKRRPFGGPLLAEIPVFRSLNGRLAPTDPGCLRIVATLRNIDWILRFHDALLRALALHGCKVEARQWNDSHVVEIHGSGEYVGLSFAEEFETKERKDPHRPWDTKEYVAKDTYKLKLDRPLSSAKLWVGDQARLTELLPFIARDIATLLSAQAEMRKVRDAEEVVRKAETEKRAEESRLWFAAQKLIGERKAARKAQVDRAKAAGRAYDEFLSLRRLVSEVEARTAPGDEAVIEWLSLVRVALADPVDQLLQEVRAEAARDEKPLWWPEKAPKADGPD
jgi:hypothetical protein